MKRHLVSVFLMALLLCSVGRTSLASPHGEAKSKSDFLTTESTSSTEHRPGVILVKFRPDVPMTEAADTLGARDLAVLGEVADLQIHRVAVPEGREEALVEVLTQDPRVEYAEVDYAVHATIIPNDTRYYLQWGPAKIQAPAAWDVTVGSSDLIIAVVDTGVDLNHPDLNDKIVAGWDYANDDSDPQDDHGHGTHVAGIAAAETNNLQGIAGISWAARIMPVKVLDEHGDGYYSDVADGVHYACNNGAKIINLSLGGSNPSSTLKDALEDAYEDGCLMVAAAGNGGNAVDYPGRYPETMAVAATNQSDTRAGFSDYGPEIDVAAPGVYIYSTLWNDKYGWKDGTSMAAPHVAGQAALIWSLC
ncbi:MAG: S8 family peptidase, partial [Anaerolineae bacterium]